MKTLLVNIGGSNRKLKRQFMAFKAAGIDLNDCGTRTLGVHHSNHSAVMPDTLEARNLLKQVGGTVPRRQPEYLKDESPKGIANEYGIILEQDEKG